MYFTAGIGFEEIVYPTSESEESVDICVAVKNGIMDFNLQVQLEILPTSTATGGHLSYVSLL